MTKWFCSLCWRHGDIEGDTLRHAKLAHDADLQEDKAAYKLPSGIDERARNAPSMLRFTAVYCVGDVHFGEKPVRRRIKKELPPLIFSESELQPQTKEPK